MRVRFYSGRHISLFVSLSKCCLCVPSAVKGWGLFHPTSQSCWINIPEWINPESVLSFPLSQRSWKTFCSHNHRGFLSRSSLAGPLHLLCPYSPTFHLHIRSSKVTERLNPCELNIPLALSPRSLLISFASKAILEKWLLDCECRSEAEFNSSLSLSRRLDRLVAITGVLVISKIATGSATGLDLDPDTWMKPLAVFGIKPVFTMQALTCVWWLRLTNLEFIGLRFCWAVDVLPCSEVSSQVLSCSGAQVLSCSAAQAGSSRPVNSPRHEWMKCKSDSFYTY